MATLSEKRMNDPRFVGLSRIANDALLSAAKKAVGGTELLPAFESHANRVVDDLTALLFRLSDEASQ